MCAFVVMCYLICSFVVARAISNATSGGTDAQIRYLANQGVIPPLCELFTCPDAKIIMVAMEGIENILRVGKQDAAADPQNINQYADAVDHCKGIDFLEQLQHHQNEEIYNKAMTILKSYFVAEDGDGTDVAPAAAQAQDGSQYEYQPQQQAGNGGGFAF